MKKKLLAILMGIAVTAIGGATLAACTPEENSGGSYFQEVYSLYVANAADSGETPLTYEEWLESIRGEKGDKGDKGDTGTPGTPGTPGTNGENGKSAYQVWLDAGNSGSEQDFIDFITGDPGTPGTPGAAGTPGTPGTNGNDGIGIDDVSIEMLDIGGDSYTLYKITLTDGSVITKLVPVTTQQNPDYTAVSGIEKTLAYVNKIGTTDPEPTVLYRVRYYNGESELISMDDVNILGSEPDFTTVGYYEYIIEYKGYYTYSEIQVVEDGNTDFASLRNITEDEDYDLYYLWFSGDTAADNVKNMNEIDYLRNDSISDRLVVTDSMITGIPEDPDEGVCIATLTSGGRSISLPLYILNTTKAEYISDNAALADSGEEEQPTISQVSLNLGTATNDRYNIFIGQTDLFDPQYDYITVFSGFDDLYGFAYFNLPLTPEMLVNSETQAAFSNAAASDAATYVLKDPIGGVTCTDEMTIAVYNRTSATITSISCDERILPTASATTIPHLYMWVAYIVEGTIDDYDAQFVFEEVYLDDTNKVSIENREYIDFSNIGIHSLNLAINGKYYANLIIQTVNPTYENLMLSNLYDIDYRDTPIYDYDLGDKTQTEITEIIFDDLIGKIYLEIGYFDKVNGQQYELVVITEEMFDFSTVVFNKIGVYEVYVNYGEGVNKVTKLAAIIRINPENIGTATGTLYGDALYNTFVFYDSNIVAVTSNFIQEIVMYGTYTIEGTDLVITTSQGKMYYTITEFELAESLYLIQGKTVTPTGTPVVYEIVDGAAIDKISVYEDYLTFQAIIGDEVLYTITIDAITNNKVPSFFLPGNYYELMPDHTIVLRG